MEWLFPDQDVVKLVRDWRVLSVQEKGPLAVILTKGAEGARFVN